MKEQEQEKLVESIHYYVTDNFPLANMSDEDLEEHIRQEVEKRCKEYGFVPIEQRASISDQVFSAIRGFGILDTIMKDDDITEIMINGPEEIFVEKKGRVQALNKKFDSERRLEDVVQKIVGQAGREVNQANPIVDTRLPDGSRVNVVLPPISLKGAIVTIRKFSKTPMTVDMLLKYKSITPEVAEKLQILVRARYNIFICGGTGCGKTTFLNAISNYIPHDERVITIEDSAELQIEGVDNLVTLESRNANSSGSGEISIRDLIKSSLRMRPDRIIVGEVRGGEALDMLQAIICTI